MTDLRVGNGFDVHRFVKGRKLILGGIKIEHETGLDGHSDADVLVHAIIDSLCGAAGIHDIGQHFPPTDPKYKDADSIELLKEVLVMIKEKRFEIVNIDSTVMCEQPKLNRYIPKMCERLASVCNLTIDRINIKATTTEKLGFTGREEGIAAMAVCLLEYHG